jgi:hypothetical protein
MKCFILSESKVPFLGGDLGEAFWQKEAQLVPCAFPLYLHDLY